MIFAKTKNRGLFNKEARSEDVEKHTDLIKQAQEALDAIRKEELQGEVIEDNEFEENRLEKDNNEPVKEVYKKELRYDDLDEIKESFDIEKYLKDKGHNIDYANLLEHEKNEIMIELMLLKNLDKITEEEYKKETVKLWKK